MGTYEVVGENVELVVATEVVVIFIIVVKEVGGADVVVDVDIGKLSFVVLIVVVIFSDVVVNGNVSIKLISVVAKSLASLNNCLIVSNSLSLLIEVARSIPPVQSITQKTHL